MGKGVIEKHQDFRFGLDGVGATVAANIDGRFLIQDGRSEDIVDRGHMLYLLSKSSDAFELARCGGERILVFGHGVSGADELAGADVENCIDGVAGAFGGRHGHLSESESGTTEYDENS